MSGIGGIVRWDDAPVTEAEPRQPWHRYVERCTNPEQATQ